jgi:hypothetical protein
MLETDADRLASIQALGGQLCTVGSSKLLAVFDNNPQDELTAPGVEGYVPILQCRTSDLQDVQKDVPVLIDGEPYRVRKVERNAPAPGWTTLRLKR